MSFTFGASQGSSGPSLNPSAQSFKPQRAHGSSSSNRQKPSTAAINQLLRALAAAYAARDVKAWSEALILSPQDGHRWQAIKAEVEHPSAQLPGSSEITAIFSHAGGAPSTSQQHQQSVPAALITFIQLYLTYLSTARWDPDEICSSSPKQAEQEWRAFDLAYAEANRLWAADKDAGWLGKGLRRMAEVAVMLAFRSSRISRDKRFTAPSTTVDRIRRTFQIAVASDCRSSPSEVHSPAKRGDVTFALGNLCWRVYTELKAYRLLDTIAQMYHASREGVRERLMAVATSQKERVAYYYWNGTLRLAKGEVRAAREDLQHAFDACPVSAPKNQRAIFIRLVTCQILLGRLPRPHLLAHFGLEAQFSPLIQAIKTGDRAMYYTCFQHWSEWYRKRGIWLVLREKGELIVWRSLFRSAYRIWAESEGASAGAASGSGKSLRCPTHIFLTAARFSFSQCPPAADASTTIPIDPEDVVNMLASLIDQSYIRGQLSYTNQYLVMPNVADDPFAGFPAVGTVRPRAVHAVG